jgi:hypothetical protein
MLNIGLRLKHRNNMTCREFLALSNFPQATWEKVVTTFDENWVLTVGDLRIVIQEGLLRDICIPVRLCTWIENELIERHVTVESEAKLARLQSFIPSYLQGKGTVFQYQSDLDENGFLFYIGSARKSAAWQNPASSGLVSVSCSSLLEDSVPEAAVVGRSVVRCVTKASKNSWFAVDLISCYLRPTHYTLRHYSSWDTECVRSWLFQGSKDGVAWVNLKAHVNDPAISTAGGTHTWALDALSASNESANTMAVLDEYFRVFRVLQTGKNSNDHHYLCVSGLELYGHALLAHDVAALTIEAQLALASIRPRTSSGGVTLSGSTPQLARAHNEYLFRNDFDGNGVIFALATRGGLAPWTNPLEAGALELTTSSLMHDSFPLSFVVRPAVDTAQ